MQRVIGVRLSGHEAPIEMDEDAHDKLRHCLNRYEARLGKDLDEVIRDLEQSIGEKLFDRMGSHRRVANLADVNAVLGEVGALDEEAGAVPEPDDRLGRRRLLRIKEGQWIAGVCTGLAAYADVRVDWVRLLFLVLAAGSIGVFLVIYIALVFLLPVIPTHEAYRRLQRTK